MALTFVLSGCANAPTFLKPASSITAEETQLYEIIVVLSAIVFLIVEGPLIHVLVRYRLRRADDEIPGQTYRNLLLELDGRPFPDPRDSSVHLHGAVGVGRGRCSRRRATSTCVLWAIAGGGNSTIPTWASSRPTSCTCRWVESCRSSWNRWTSSIVSGCRAAVGEDRCPAGSDQPHVVQSGRTRRLPWAPRSTAV
ncbi:MAG: hypothetical protein R2838_05835 [Caldilineaceae bacterium]